MTYYIDTLFKECIAMDVELEEFPAVDRYISEAIVGKVDSDDKRSVTRLEMDYAYSNSALARVIHRRAELQRIYLLRTQKQKLLELALKIEQGRTL